MGSELSLKEAAETLGISLSTARRWIKLGRLRATLREGSYGPEYVVTQEELKRVRQERPVHLTVIAPESKDQQGITVSREWLSQAMRQALMEVLAGTIDQTTRGMNDTLTAIVKSTEATLVKQWIGVEQGLRQELEKLQAELATTQRLLKKQEKKRRLAEAEYERLWEEQGKQLAEEIPTEQSAAGDGVPAAPEPQNATAQVIR